MITHCKRCGVKLKAMCDTQDGLCSMLHDASELDTTCYTRWLNWVESHNMAHVLVPTPSDNYDTPERLVAIDLWLERGTP